MDFASTVVTGQSDSIEHELEVGNANKLEAIIRLLGFDLYSDLTKIHAKGMLRDIEICVYTVLELGLTEMDQAHGGYGIIMRQKQMA